MPHPLRKFGKFLVQCLEKFWRVFFLKHRKLSTEDGLVAIDLRRPETIIREIPLSLIGVGVCRGEAIILRTWRPENPYQNLEAEKLQYRSLGLIDKRLVKSLYCLAHRLEYEIQSCQQMTDSQKPATIKLNTCLPLDRDNQSLLKPSSKEDDSDAILTKQETKKDKERQYLDLMQCHSCPLLYHKEKIMEGLQNDTEKT